MADIKTQRIKTISEYHQLRGLPKLEHPLISIIDIADIKRLPDNGEENIYTAGRHRNVDLFACYQADRVVFPTTESYLAFTVDFG